MNTSFLHLLLVALLVVNTSCTYQKAKQRETARIKQGEEQLGQNQAKLADLEAERSSLLKKRANSQAKINSLKKRQQTLNKQGAHTQDNIAVSKEIVELLKNEEQVLREVDALIARSSP